MNKEEIAEVARVAAQEVLARKDAIIDEEFDARYHDVNLLMKNYRKLRAHYAHVSPETLEVSCICSMRRKTGLMMSHVDKMLAAYEALCKEAVNPDEARRAAEHRQADVLPGHQPCDGGHGRSAVWHRGHWLVETQEVTNQGADKAP